MIFVLASTLRRSSAVVIGLLSLTWVAVAQDDIPENPAPRSQEVLEDIEIDAPVLAPGLYPKIGADPAKPNRTLVTDYNPKNRVKQGHWYEATPIAVSRKIDFRGELQIMAVDARGRPVRLPYAPFQLVSRRGVSLPKTQWKQLESTVYIPPRLTEQSIRAATLKYDLMPATSLNNPTILLQSGQFHFVILDQNPSRFVFLEKLSCIGVPDEFLGGGEDLANYHCVYCSADGTVPWPHSLLTSTTIDMVLWGDLSPDRLDEGQQQALVDWIHWGGNLILSGPDCLERLSTSFLAPYLPASFDGYQEVDSEPVREISDHWTQRDNLAMMIPARLASMKFKLAATAEYEAHCGELVCSRRVGRGRIVATAFSFDTELFKKWADFNGFVRDVLLNRPEFKSSERLESPLNNFGQLGYRGSDQPKLSDVDPKLSFIGRDAMPPVPEGADEWLRVFESADAAPGAPVKHQPLITEAEPETSSTAPLDTSELRMVLLNAAIRLHGEIRRTAGGAAWNDGSVVAGAAQIALRESAGIKPPTAVWVMRMLLIYLVVLVPVNYAVFKFMGASNGLGLPRRLFPS